MSHKSHSDIAADWTEQDLSYAASIILRVFRTYDVDKGGTLQRRELRHFLRRCGANLSADQCDDIIAQLDSDGDGEMNFAEFMAFIGRLYQLQFYGTDSGPPTIPQRDSVPPLPSTPHSSNFTNTNSSHLSGRHAASSYRHSPAPPPVAPRGPPVPPRHR